MWNQQLRNYVYKLQNKEKMMIPIINKNSVDGCRYYRPPETFPIGPFHRYEKNPIMKPDPNVEWESHYLYNATAIVVDNKVFMLYRAQNKEKVSSIGIAWSNDGVHFIKHKNQSLLLQNLMKRVVVAKTLELLEIPYLNYLLLLIQHMIK